MILASPLTCVVGMSPRCLLRLRLRLLICRPGHFKNSSYGDVSSIKSLIPSSGSRSL